MPLVLAGALRRGTRLGLRVAGRAAGDGALPRRLRGLWSGTSLPRWLTGSKGGEGEGKDGWKQPSGTDAERTRAELDAEEQEDELKSRISAQARLFPTGRRDKRRGVEHALPGREPEFEGRLPNSMDDLYAWETIGRDGIGTSVSDHDNWGGPAEAARASWGKEAEDKLFNALDQEDPSGRWKQEAWLRPMGEQRRKPFKRHYPTLDSSLDEGPGRRLAHGGLIPRPNKIILVRHGESQGNDDETVYTRVSDWRISLTPKGKSQAREVGVKMREVVGDGEVFFYHSPYYRTVETCQEIMEAFDPRAIRGIREDPRMAEQQFGNLQDAAQIRKSKNERHRYGRFFYRFPQGEAGLDVYNRVTSFIDTLRRDHLEEDVTIIIVTHGLALRLFLMAWFQWTVEEFEDTENPPNCGLAVMERITGEDRYKLTAEAAKILGCDKNKSTEKHPPSTSPGGSQMPPPPDQVPWA